MTETLRLYTFAVSHFSEKSRWMLDASQVDYEEVSLTPWMHIPGNLLRSRKTTTVPILQQGDHYLQGSTRILLRLAEQPAGAWLLPQASAEREDALAVIKRFDRVGSNVIRYAYQSALPHKAAVVAMWTIDAKPLTRRVISASFPLLRAAMRKTINITPAAAARSEEKIDAACTWLEAELADGRAYVQGETMTGVDISIAALLAPLACPTQHRVYSQPEYREIMQQLLGSNFSRPALEWVRKLYASRR